MKTFGIYSKWDQLHPWSYFSNINNGWLCKICKEYSETGGHFWKRKARAHDEHPNKMFQQQLNSDKHKKATSRKHTLHSMLRKGSIKMQTRTGILNSEMKRGNRNRRVLNKFIKTMYFMCRKKWSVKNNFTI